MKNEQPAAAPSRSLPAWLDGSTIAIIAAIVGAVLSLGAMQDASESRTRSHIDTRVDDVNRRIDGLETSVNRRFDVLDDRVRVVEVAVAEIRGHLGLLRRPALPDDGNEAKEETTPPDAVREPTS